MAKSRLYHLERQLESTINALVDAPGGVEVAQAVKSFVLRPAVLIDHTGGNLCRLEAARNDGGALLDAAPAVREDEAELPVRAGEAMLAQGGDQHRRERNRALARRRLGPPDLAVTIGALADVQLAPFQVDIVPAQAAQLGGA